MKFRKIPSCTVLFSHLDVVKINYLSNKNGFWLSYRVARGGEYLIVERLGGGGERARHV